MITEASSLPQDNEVVTVSTSPHGVSTPDGREEFTVWSDQLIR
ncbi:hypothetical protein OG257_00465 [Streptomyces sp. NBC_00683]|nr:hypothetical protein [Streptomyces sp. NBC_00683]